MNLESLLDLLADVLGEWAVPLDALHLCRGCPRRIL